MTHLSPHHGGERGFTLIELLVSTTILALVMGLVALAVQVMSDGWHRGGQAAATHDMLGRASDVLRRDFRGARRPVVPAGRQVGKKPAFLFAGTSKSIIYVVREPPYPTTPGLYVIRLSQRTIAGRTQLIRSRHRYDPDQSATFLKAAGQSAELGDAVVLIEGRFNIGFSYLGSTGKATWQTDWPDRQRMPALVKVSFRNRQGVSALPDIVTALSVDAEAACVAGSGACTIQTEGRLPDSNEKKPPAQKKNQRSGTAATDHQGR